jgi:hypothetical protein
MIFARWRPIAQVCTSNFGLPALPRKVGAAYARGPERKILLFCGGTQMLSRVSAVFTNRAQAEQALMELRRLGVSDAKLSILSPRNMHPELAGGGGGAVTDRVQGNDVAEATGKGLLGGAGIGALFGLAAMLIPGVGPFVAAGALATALGAVGGTVAAGAIVGATSGAIAGALAKAGYNEHEANWYAGELERGAMMVAVDTQGVMIPETEIRDVLVRFGGRIA